MEKIRTFWKNKYSVMSFYFDDNGKMITKLYSKVYPDGKVVKGWDYEKIGFGLKTEYDRINESEFKTLVNSLKK